MLKFKHMHILLNQVLVVHSVHTQEKCCCVWCLINHRYTCWQCVKRHGAFPPSLRLKFSAKSYLKELNEHPSTLSSNRSTKKKYKLEAIPQTLLETLAIALSTSAFRQEHILSCSRLARNHDITALKGAGIF